MSNGTLPVRVRVVLGLAAVLVTAACGGGSTSPPTAGPSTQPDAGQPSEAPTSEPKSVRHVEVAAPEPTAATDTFPVSVEHAFGPTVIAQEPRRVVALGTFDNDTILALGVTPLTVHPQGHTRLEPVNEWADFSVDGAAVEFLTSAGDPNYEVIAGLKPDLIVNVSTITSDEEFAALSKIAPMVTRNDRRGAATTTWQEQTRMLGRALGRSRRADSLISALETRIAAIAADNPSFAGKTVLVTEYRGAGEQLDPSFSSSGVPALLSALGFQVLSPPGRIDPMSLDEAVVDLLVWDIYDDPTKRAEIEADPRLRSLAVMQDDRVVYVESPVSSAILHESVVSLRFGLEKLTPLLQAATSR